MSTRAVKVRGRTRRHAIGARRRRKSSSSRLRLRANNRSITSDHTTRMKLKMLRSDGSAIEPKSFMTSTSLSRAAQTLFSIPAHVP